MIKNHQENLEVGEEMTVGIGNDQGQEMREDADAIQGQEVIAETGNTKKTKNIRKIRKDLRGLSKEKSKDKCKSD